MRGRTSGSIRSADPAKHLEHGSLSQNWVLSD